MSTFGENVQEGINKALKDLKRGVEPPKYPDVGRVSEIDQLIQWIEQEEKELMQAPAQQEQPQKSFVNIKQERGDGRVKPKTSPREKPVSYIQAEEERSNGKEKLVPKEKAESHIKAEEKRSKERPEGVNGPTP